VAFLGYNPVQHLVGASTLAKLTSAQRGALLGHSFFPKLIEAPFHSGLREAFGFSILACLIAAAASWSRGKQYVDYGSSRSAASGAAKASPVIDS
jgi:hypothetical protein